jgi:hypothetical protein
MESKQACGLNGFMSLEDNTYLVDVKRKRYCLYGMWEQLSLPFIAAWKWNEEVGIEVHRCF